MTVHAGSSTLIEYGWSVLGRLNLDARVVNLVFDAPPLYAFDQMPNLIDEGQVVVVTNSLSVPYLRNLLDFAPEGLLALPVTTTELTRFVERVAMGERLHLLPPLRACSLTGLERAILHQLARGLDNAEVARELGVTKKTVANRVSEICSKLGVRGRTQAVLYYLGLLE